MTTLARRYRLEEVIGRGGMSTVYRATDGILQRTVAVKVMSAALAEGDPSHIARFEREARAAASLVHPGIVTVYDTGVDGDQRFIAMEYIDGESLARVIAHEAPLEPDRAREIAAQVADALEAAHRAGLVHRDVKPGNVMIARDGSAKVLDFGIARVADAGSITRTATLLGTAAYMAPEHALGSPVDARSDIYSLGCVLYAMLTGDPPFGGEVAAAVLHQQVNAVPRPPSQANPRVGRDLDALVLQMLAKAPDERPQSAAEVRDRLREAPVSQAPPTAATAPLSEAAAPLEATAATQPLADFTRGAAGGVPPPPPPRRDDRLIRLLAGVVAIAVVAVIVAVALGTGGGTTSHSGTQTQRSSAGSTRPTTTSTSRSTPTHTTSTTTPTTTVTVTTPGTTSASTPTPAAPAPPGPAARPPGHKGKGDKKHGHGGG
jgi:serine/threonine-protein kinase